MLHINPFFLQMDAFNFRHPLPSRVPKMDFSYSDHEGVMASFRISKGIPLVNLVGIASTVLTQFLGPRWNHCQLLQRPGSFEGSALDLRDGHEKFAATKVVVPAGVLLADNSSRLLHGRGLLARFQWLHSRLRRVADHIGRCFVLLFIHGLHMESPGNERSKGMLLGDGIAPQTRHLQLSANIHGMTNAL